MGGAARAAVDLLHVVEYGPPSGRWAAKIYTAEAADLQATLVRNAEARLRYDVALVPRTNVPVTSEVQLGRVASTIVAKAASCGASVIVAGTRGQTGLPHLLLGSVAERIVRTAPCPVLTVHAERPGGIRRILVATDFSPASQAALHAAARLATAFGAALDVIHVVEDPFPMGGDVYVRTVTEIREYLLRGARTELARSLGSIPEVEAMSEAVAGTPARTIIGDGREARRRSASSWARTGATPSAHLVLGSVADRVTRTAPCPLLTARADQGAAWAERDQTSAAARA